MFDSKGDNFIGGNFKISFARTSCIDLKHFKNCFINIMKKQGKTAKQNLHMYMRVTNFLSYLITIPVRV